MATDLPGFDQLAGGDKRALSEVLAAIEEDGDDPRVLALLRRSWSEPKAQVVGITGPPGVGKSTLIGTLISIWRKQERTVAVIAVDPSSRRTGGALLGDRIRLSTNTGDAGVFVRSMAARDRLGGLAALTVSAMVVMRAVYDLVVVETVGVGQSETDVADAVDTVVFCVQPGSGDSLQFLKAGIMEIPDIICVTKADMGDAASRARADVTSVLSITGHGARPVPVLSVSAEQNTEVEGLAAAIDDHGAWLGEDGRREATRYGQSKAWLRRSVRERFGREGLARAGALLDLPADCSPFDREAEIAVLLRG